MSRLLTVPQAAERLGVRERFIRRLVFERRIPYTKLGRHVRLEERDLEGFIDANRVEPEHTPPSLGQPRARAGKGPHEA